MTIKENSPTQIFQNSQIKLSNERRIVKNMTEVDENLSLERFLYEHNTPANTEHTNTRIGNKSTGLIGGSYSIPVSEYQCFLDKYYNRVIENNKPEYLTEKQLIEDGPILVDLDLRYNTSTTERQHSLEHLIDITMQYMVEIDEIIEINTGQSIDVFIMEKPHVNITNSCVKDGIHIIICISMHKALQCILRERVLKELPALWEGLNITNSWEDVIDEGVTKGFVNWQMYGSRKPGHEAYSVKYHCVLKREEQDWTLNYSKGNKFDISTNFNKLSARYTEHPQFEIKDAMKEEFENAKATLNRKVGKNTNKPKPSMLNKLQNRKDTQETLKINNMEELDAMLEEFLDNISPQDYVLKETHQYTMCLPISYYGPGSYNKWIRVGWALANTDSRLFLTWLKLSSQNGCRNTLRGVNGVFDWNMVHELWGQWLKFDVNNSEGLTHRSIMFWAKSDALSKYTEVRKDTVNYYIDQSGQVTGNIATEWDLACVLYQMYKDRFVCVSISKNVWYEFNGHKWYEIDSGNTLRLYISSTMHTLYVNRVRNDTDHINSGKLEEEKRNVRAKILNIFLEVCQCLKKTQWKNNIMREARELFYDREFIEKLDCNPYLMCFKNGVIDFKSKEFRRGRPDDYLSMSTGIDYIPLKKNIHDNTISEIEKFFVELFPNAELRKYMWEHLASILIGITPNQTFNIYIGSGRNGKSCLVDLMTQMLGEYKGTVPITLITAKRNTIGSTSSEVAQLKGVRYAVMQEPSKGDKINEGILKEITGGDPIQARALFKDTITFVPQFTLVVCTNVLFELNSTDDGTLRRFRLCDFQSKFLEKPYEDDIKFPKAVCPYQYKLDKHLSDKFVKWAPILMSMLVKIAFKKQGLVEDCSVVMASTERYRESQDYLAEFAKEHIVSDTREKIKKSELYNTFKEWYTTNYGRGAPKAKEVYEFMDTRYGHYNQGWHNVKIRYEEDDIMEGV
jgi:P4 family phage/plasmid primase-like protien